MTARTAIDTRLTAWFTGSAKPARPGVYERGFRGKGSWYSRWDGVFWYGLAVTPEMAAAKRYVSVYQDLPWRGLRRKP
jgi:hypothetical protein